MTEIEKGEFLNFLLTFYFVFFRCYGTDVTLFRECDGRFSASVPGVTVLYRTDHVLSLWIDYLVLFSLTTLIYLTGYLTLRIMRQNVPVVAAREATKKEYSTQKAYLRNSLSLDR